MKPDPNENKPPLDLYEVMMNPHLYTKLQYMSAVRQNHEKQPKEKS